VKNFGAGIINGAKSAFNAVFNFIGGLGANFHKAMSWMYNHNYYWQAMVDGAHVNLNKLNKFIGDFSTAAQKDWGNFWTSANQTVSGKMKDINTGVQNGWNATSKWWNDGLNVQKAYWSKHWGELQSETSSAMGGINRGIQGGWNWAMGYINVGVNAARGLFNYLFGWVPGAASSAFHSAASGISSGIDTAKGAVSSGLGYINNLVGGWGAQLQQFGSNAVKLFADGIRGGIGWVNDAVHSVAQSIWTTLGFHSPPKGGILSDSDQYMPNMMKMYGAGIRNNLHHVKNAVGDVASTIHKGFTTPMTQAVGTAYAGMSSASSANNPNTTINLQMDSKVVGQVVIDRVTGQLVMNGLNRRMR
jgi:phage-related protein